MFDTSEEEYQEGTPVKFAMVGPDGSVAFTAVPSDPEFYVDGEEYVGYVARLLPEEVDEATAASQYYWDDGWKVREPMPSIDHVWEPVAKEWVIDFAGRQERLRPQINSIRDRLEAGRVTVDGHLIDIDERAEKRMSDALELWDALGVTTLPWTLGDNTILHVDKAQLQRFYDEGRRLRALRSLQLHTEARALKDNLDTTQEDIDAWEASYA